MQGVHATRRERRPGGGPERSEGIAVSPKGLSEEHFMRHALGAIWTTLSFVIRPFVWREDQRLRSACSAQVR